MTINDQSFAGVWHAVANLCQIIQPLRNNELECSDIPGMRRLVRTKLREIHQELGSYLSDRDAYYALFALVAHVDEMAQVHVQLFNSPTGWEPLQYELFDMTGAGDLFYGYVDAFRGRNDIPMFVYEIYYFCLNDGFRGKYITNPEARDMYAHELRAYISPRPIPHRKEDIVEQKVKPFRPSPWMYYAALIILFVIANKILSSIPLRINLAN